MKVLLGIFMLFISSLTFSQNEVKKNSKEALTDFNMHFVTEKNNLDTLIVKFKNLKEKISVGDLDKLADELKIEKEKIILSDEKISKIIDSAQTFKKFSLYSKELTEEDADKLIKDINTYVKDPILDKANEVTEAKIFTYFDKNTVFSEKELFNKGTAEHEVIKNVLQQNVKTYFGDITIPKDKQTLYFYNDNDSLLHDKTYYFKKISLNIKDGAFSDIKVYVEYEGKTHIYENIKGISVFRFADVANKNKLFYKQTIMGTNKSVQIKDMNNLYIKLSDVLVYDCNIENNYIPADLTIELPQNDVKNNPTNFDNPAQYQIKQDTDLDKIVELRTYSDFLALFGDSENGLVQIEGKAKFYAFPFPNQVFGFKSQIEFVSDFSPFVNYSRFENNSKYVGLNATQTNVETTLDLVQKRFLTMGVEANILKLKHKNYPVEGSLYGVAAYQLSPVNLGNEDDPVIENIKALSYGGGVNLGVRRFNHFGFNYRFEFLWFDYKNYNNISTFSLPEKLLPVVKNEAEIFYKTGSSANSAIFIRLITYNNSSSKNNEAFYQFQFGYKFSIGNRVAK